MGYLGRFSLFISYLKILCLEMILFLESSLPTIPSLPTINNSKGMEMWQVVLIILSLLLLFFLFAWSGDLGSKMEALLSGVADRF